MKALLTKKTVVIVSIAVLIALVTVISVNVFESSGPVTAIANAVSSPFKSLASAVANTFESIYSAIYEYNDLMEDFENAQREITRLENAYREYVDLYRENIMLRELLGFRRRHAGHVYEEAVIINWSSNNFISTFTISKGYENSETSIARGNSVITESGVLIGQITEVGATMSTVVSIIDTTFSAGAFVGASEDSVTLKGDFSLMSRGLLMLDHLGEDLVVLPGDTVVTSSAGGVFPVGLVVGEVIEVLRHSTGVGRYAIVRPMRSIDSTILNVYAITSFDIMG